MNMARSNKDAFTLIELMVVVAIIGLLIGISVPAFKRVRVQAKVVDSRQLITNLESGLSTFQAERALGGRLPPSASDAQGGNAGTIIDYNADGTGPRVPATGATLLVLAMAGPDKLGTAGFRPDSGFASWADSIGGLGSGGLYDTNNGPSGTRVTPATRYGPYVGDSGMKKIKSIKEVKASGFLIPTPSDVFGRQQVFTDLLKSPILYYRARKASRRMITDNSVDPALVGIYDHNDNAALTSWPDAAPLINRHRIAAPGAVASPMVVPDAENSDTFASFILDRKASGCSDVSPITCPRAIPHRAKDFLLISAGPDGLWGTPDDITNWK